jgi:hypothetical protein
MYAIINITVLKYTITIQLFEIYRAERETEDFFGSSSRCSRTLWIESICTYTYESSIFTAASGDASDAGIFTNLFVGRRAARPCIRIGAGGWEPGKWGLNPGQE